MRFLIAGDIIPTEKNKALFFENRVDELLGPDFSKSWYAADHRIANLETPLTECCNQKKKFGLNLKCSPKVISGLKGLNFSVLGCANNHLLDYDLRGLEDTVQLLSEHGIPYGGIGKNSEDYMRYALIRDERQRIGVYFCCDIEFSCASTQQPGAIGFDCYNTMKAIRKMKDEVDVVIVVYHSGIEFFQYPSPGLRRDCMAMVDAGADLVVCQHGHCIASKEEYNGSQIIYGHGHFISNLSSASLTKTELVIQVDIEEGKVATVEYIPLCVTEEDVLRVPEEAERTKILQEFEERSEEVRTGAYLKRYSDYVTCMKKNYVLSLRGSSFFNRLILRFFPQYLEHMYREAGMLQLWNYTHSKIHREIIESIFENWRKKICST